MLSVFCSPSRYVQGRNATESLASELLKLGHAGRALIIASRTARKQLESIWRNTFTVADVPLDILDFGEECCQDEIARCKEEALRVELEHGLRSLGSGACACPPHLSLPQAQARLLPSGMSAPLLAQYTACAPNLQAGNARGARSRRGGTAGVR